MEIRRLSRGSDPPNQIDELRGALQRLTANASRELLVKQPHWGDAILCDGLLYAARALKTMRRSTPRGDGSRRSSRPGRAPGMVLVLAAEALPALDLYLQTNDARYLDYARSIVSFMEESAARTPDGAFVPHPPALEVWIDVAISPRPQSRCSVESRATRR